MLTQTLKRTPLYEEHLAQKARLVAFGGWEMPVQYKSILTEYEHTRLSASLFDISHMGEFLIKGDADKTGLGYLITSSIQEMPLKSCRYGMILNEDGGIIDDLIVFRIDQKEWMLVVNAATMKKDEKHFLERLNPKDCFENITMETGN